MRILENIPDFLEHALLYGNEYEGYADDVPEGYKPISVTYLIDAPYPKILFEKHKDELKIPLRHRVYALFGKIGHAMIMDLEKFKDYDKLELEKRHSIKYELDGVGKYILNGQVDLFDSRSNTIYDFKFTSQWVFKYGGGYKKEWQYQLNIYKYIMEKLGYKIDNLMIIGIIRDIVSANIKPDQMMDNEVVFCEIPMMSNEEIEEYINNRLIRHERADYCTEDERWAKPTVFAVYDKPGAVKASKLFYNEKDFNEYIRIADYHHVEIRDGEDKRCVRYCPVNKFCEYFIKNYIEKGVKNGKKD